MLEGASRKAALQMKDSAAIYPLSFAFSLPFSWIAELIHEMNETAFFSGQSLMSSGECTHLEATP